MHKYNDPKFFWTYKIVDWFSWAAVIFAIAYFLHAALEMNGILVIRPTMQHTTNAQ